MKYLGIRTLNFIRSELITRNCTINYGSSTYLRISNNMLSNVFFLCHNYLIILLFIATGNIIAINLLHYKVSDSSLDGMNIFSLITK